MMIVLIALPVWVVGWSVLFALIDPSLPKSDGHRTDLSGVYRFSRSNIIGDNYGGHGGTPIIYTPSMTDGSKVVIQHTPQQELTVVSKGRRTRQKSMNLTDDQFAWNQGTLWFVSSRYTASSGGVLPGFSRRCKSSKIECDASGNIIISFWFWDRGLLFYIIPHWESHSSSITLNRLEKKGSEPVK